MGRGTAEAGRGRLGNRLNIRSRGGETIAEETDDGKKLPKQWPDTGLQDVSLGPGAAMGNQIGVGSRKTDGAKSDKDKRLWPDLPSRRPLWEEGEVEVNRPERPSPNTLCDTVQRSLLQQKDRK